ncbi:MAG: tetratricopeptide repeat protein [Candidatus Sulfobium sp.]|jgi:tetratricopeptide (TPR) repeat protein
MKKLYDQKEVARLTGISENQIRYWDRIGLIPHTEKKGRVLFFDFRALASFRTVREMLNKGIPLRRIRKSVEKLKKLMPGAGNSLREISVSIHGDQLVIVRNNRRFTPEGQLFIDFSMDAASPVPLPVDAAERLFFGALEAEQQGDWKEAEKGYRAVLSHKPGHADAMVNMGNIRHRLGLRQEAETLYRKALWIDPDHIEANYNLANLLEENGDARNAVLFYKKALHEDPEFADAHFNVALLLDRLGETEEAKVHWLRYLELDPDGQWAESIRSLLDK